MEPKPVLMAVAICRLMGPRIVTIPNVFDNTFLNGIANEELPSGTVDYWIGGSTAYNQGWQWVDNSNMNYTLWDSKQPINTNGSYCMVQQIRNGKWAQSMCNLTKPYICKVPSNLGPQCPTGWAYSGVTKKCYLLTTQMQSWNDSLTLCQNFNASLVSIHSALENMITSSKF
uniref:C-type lectin domain-containing protein n=1 Tax=Acrobeloides nanus TaxID=290746 RepID=A0A914D926_9BILA